MDVLFLSFWACHEITQGTACDDAMFARSDDAGNSFSSPVVVNKPPAGQNPSQPAVGPDGTIYETFQRRYRDGRVDLLMAMSADDGVSFTESPIDSERDLGLQYDAAKLVVDPVSGALYCVWSDSRTGSQQIFLRKSLSKGAVWSAALMLGPHEGGTSRSPAISVAPDGRIDVVYYHTLAGQPALDDVYLSSSTDGGATFKESKVNAKPIDRTLGYSGAASFPGRAGNHYPPGISSLDGSADVVWSDTADATTLNPAQDIEFRSVPSGARPPS